jgi:hypothetical protein
MVCVHLKALYDLCQTHQLKLGGHDLIRVVCTQCQKHDICPSTIHEDGDVMADDGDAGDDIPAPAAAATPG